MPKTAHPTGSADVRYGSMPDRNKPCRTWQAARTQRGSAIAETIVAVPILWLVIGLAVELAVLFETKSALNHAALQSARAGMVANAEPSALVNGLARGLLPLFSPEPGLAGAAETLATDVLPDVLAFSRIRVLNPTRAAFADFGENVNGKRQIPNDELHRRSTRVGGASSVNIQDANLLKVEVTYGAESTVPGLGALLARTILLLNRSQLDAFERRLLEAGRLPVLSTATVRMQTPAKINTLMITSTTEI